MPTAFGARLRWWRTRRGLSQLDLAGAAGTTQRHVSFLESGRAHPSREMVLRLATALDVPLRQQNALLLAAGFAPAWRESDLAAPELATVNRALDHMLAQQEPFPAVVVDRRWNVLRANAGAGRLTAFLTGPSPVPAAPSTVNLAEWLISPDGLRSLLVNWPEVAIYFLRGIQADAITDGTEETAELLRRLLAYPDVPAFARAGAGGTAVAGAGDALPPGPDVAAPVHHDRHARHAAGRDRSGAAHLVLFPGGCGHRPGVQRLGSSPAA
jgi:transcriptional regulator with XRE-family HTH domain